MTWISLRFIQNLFKRTLKPDESYKDEVTIRNNFDYILSHFENPHELFPRNIMTSKTGGRVKIEYESDVQKSKYKIFTYFKLASFIDCKINAFPYNTEYTLDLEVKNRTAASFIMIDLDLKDFSDKEKLDKQLKKTQIFLSNSMKNLIQQYYGQEMDIISIN